MNSKRTIASVLFLVVLLAAVIQLARTETVFKTQKNINLLYEAKNEKEVYALPEDEINRTERDSYLIVTDSGNPYCIELKNQIAQVLKQMKKDFEVQDVAFLPFSNPNKRILIICVRELDRIAEINNITDFIQNGGSAFFAAGFESDSIYYKIYRKLGIIEGAIVYETDGIKLLTDVIIGAKGFTISEDFIKNSSIALTLDKKCTLFAASYEGIPLLWERPYGKGRFMIFNGSMLNEKRNRGFLTGVISLLCNDYIYPVFNIKAIFIDDFPAPFPNGNDEGILKKYGCSIKEFFRYIWWPDMLRIMSGCDLKYNGGVIVSYDSRVSPPFTDASEFASPNLLLYGRELLMNGGELVMHGYNHQPLVIAGDTREKYTREVLGYDTFTGQNSILKSIEAFNKSFKNCFNDYDITSYIPPSNTLGEFARKELKRKLPGIETISSIYNNNLDGGAYEQEFEIAGDGIVEFPRLTYGFVKSGINNWALLNGINSLGLVSHFVHPDDVLDSQRSLGKSWDELSKEFEGVFNNIKNEYSWLRSMTMTKAGREARRVLSARMYTDYRENRINGYINGYPGDYYFILRTKKNAFAMKNCELHKIDDGIYLVRATNMSYSVGLMKIER